MPTVNVAPRKRGRKNIWDVARPLLYTRLVKLFGAHDTWGNVQTPGNGHDKKYREWAKGFAKFVGASPDRGTTNQIDWAIQKKPPKGSDPARWRNYHLNKAAAIKYGFIKA
jgi:hypothetical protein